MMAELITDMRFVGPHQQTLAGVRFGDGTLGIAVDSYCTNPECTSPHMSFTIHEIKKMEEDHPHQVGRKLCSFDLNVKTWLPDRMYEESGENDRAYMNEFIDVLDTTLKRRIRARWRQAKRPSTSAVEVPRAEAEHRFPVVYGEVFPEMPAFFVELGTRRFVIADQYCVDPECDCNEFALTMMDISQGPTQANGATLVVSLSGDAPKMLLNMGMDDMIVERVYRKWRQGLKDPDLLTKRYARMKAYGRGESPLNGSLPASPRPTGAAKIGRNQPCPCGSGKKYKRCCGQNPAM